MRKKSHISLSKYLINSMGVEDLQTHKKAFYIGSILPDCTPSFITKRHNIDETFDILKKELTKLVESYDVEKGITGYYCRHLGVITHYIADYFTFPHNVTFPGTIKDHCLYESDLKYSLRTYVKSEEAKRERKNRPIFHTVDEICLFIKKVHTEYIKVARVVREDCEYIVALCHRIVDAILQIFEFSTQGVQQYA